MSNLNNYKIAYKGLSVGEYTYEFSIGNDFFEEFEGSEINGGNCSVTVDLYRSETMLELDVTIEGEVIVDCDRCLDPCSIAVDYDNNLIVKFSDETNEYDGEVMWLPTAETELDLKMYVYESIVLSLPYQRVHPEGECNPEMISKFKIISGEELDKIENEAEKNSGIQKSDMDKLQALKESMQNEE